MHTSGCTNDAHPRRPWLAGLLSLAAPGLGQLYAGRAQRGLALFLAPLVLALGLITAAGSGAGRVVGGFLVPMVLVLGVYVYAAVDALWIASRLRQAFALRSYNHAGLYGLLLLLGLGYPLGLAALVRDRAYEVYRMSGESMEPTLAEGDRFVVNKRVLRDRPLRRGDIVVFPAPDRADQWWVKRVVGLPGDVIEIRGGNVLVNGDPVSRSPAAGDGTVEESLDGARYRILPDDGGLEPITVPDDACFLLGDHRGRSRDSRALGPIPVSSVRGLAEFVVFRGSAPWRSLVPR